MVDPLTPAAIELARYYAEHDTADSALALRLCDEIERCRAEIAQLRAEHEAMGRVMPASVRKSTTWRRRWAVGGRE